MIVDQALYVDGCRQQCGDLSDELAALRAAGAAGDFIWIGLKDPSAAEFAGVETELGLHPLAVEDAVKGHQRAKIEHYEGNVFTVLKPLRYVEETSDIETGELMLFVGDHFVVTVRRGDAAPLAPVRRALEADPSLLRSGPMAAFHAVVDAVVDDYRVIDGQVADDIDEIEQAVFGEDRTDSQVIYRLKREVLEFRRATVPLAQALRPLHASGSLVGDDELRLRLRDVDDHLQLVIDHVETYDRLLTDILGAHLTQVSVQQNDDMRRISAWVAIIAFPTMVAGIYGMNFEYMPELRWRYGYFVVLAVMVTGCAVLYRAFRRSGWL